MNLHRTRVYLSGCVEASNDPNSWRIQITPLLENMGIIVLNPLIKPDWMPQITAQQQRAMKEKLIKEEDLLQIQIENSIIRQYCLALVRICDFMIVNIDHTFTAGTFEEISLAAHKPHFIISDTEIQSMWLVDQLNYYSKYNRDLYCHKSINSLIMKLQAIHNGELSEKQLDRLQWIFLSYPN